MRLIRRGLKSGRDTLQTMRDWYRSRVMYPLRCRALRRRRLPRCYVTSIRNDGAGAQAQAIMSVMLMAHDLKLGYVHTPFTHVDHGADDGEWTSAWESHFGLGISEKSVEDADVSECTKVVRSDDVWITKLNFRRSTDPWKVLFEPETVYAYSDCHFHADLNPDGYEAILPSLRERYGRENDDRRAGVQRSWPEDGRLHVAVHIRRGDIGPKVRDNPRFTPESYYVFMIRELHKLAAERGIQADIYVFSQGSKDDFPLVSQEQVTFRLDDSPFITHRMMVEADVLVMSKSSFSYTAGLLSQGAVIYQRFWHRALSRWIDSYWDEKRRAVVVNQEAMSRGIVRAIVRQ